MATDITTLNRPQLAELIAAQGLDVKLVGTNDEIIARIQAAIQERERGTAPGVPPEKPEEEKPEEDEAEEDEAEEDEAEEVAAKEPADILDAVQLLFKGKPLETAPASDSYAVVWRNDVAESDRPSWQSVIAELRQRHPLAAFTFVAGQ